MKWNLGNFILSVVGAALNLYLLALERSSLFAVIAVMLILRAVVFGAKLTARTTPPTPSLQDEPNKKGESVNLPFLLLCLCLGILGAELNESFVGWQRRRQRDAVVKRCGGVE